MGEDRQAQRTPRIFDETDNEINAKDNIGGKHGMIIAGSRAKGR